MPPAQLQPCESTLTVNACRASVNEAIRIFSCISDAEDRIARSYFRKSLILKKLQQPEQTAKALVEAQRHRETLVGAGVMGTDTELEYDSLVVYYNK